MAGDERDATSVAPATTAADGRSLAGRRVLIVEDEYFFANDLIRAVHRNGGTVVGPAATCEDALSLIRSERIDVAVVDINLKGFAAYPAVDELNRRDVPLVFATGYTALHLPHEYRHLPHWVKPYLADTLAAALKHVLRPSER